MIPCDHGYFDPGVMALIDGLPYTGLGRIDHRAEADEDHILLLRFLIPFTIGQGKDTERFGAHLLCGFRDEKHVLVRNIPYSVCVKDTVTPHDHGIDRTLRIGNVPPDAVLYHMAQRRHHFPVGIKGNFIETCDTGHDPVISQPVVLRIFDKCGLCRVADLLS